MTTGPTDSPLVCGATRQIGARGLAVVLVCTKRSGHRGEHHDQRECAYWRGDDRCRHVLLPLDAGWPKHHGQPMWFRGGEAPVFYCDCGYERAPRPTEVRNAT